MQSPNIETEHTRLIVLGLEHAELLLDYYERNRDHLQPWEPLRSAEFYTLDSMRAGIEDDRAKYREGKAVPLSAIEKDTGRMIAGCNLSNIVRGVFQACTLGYAISHDREGQGLMYEIASAGVDYAFSDLRLHRIMANYIPRNIRSERLLQRLRFEREGYAKGYLKIAGRWEDHVLTARINPNPID